MWYRPVLEKLGCVVDKPREGKFWSFHCPGLAHPQGDHHPSGWVMISEKGRLLVRCFRGCAVEEILKAKGIAMTELFEPKQSPAVDKAVVHPRVVGTYDYCDEDGRVVYQVWRYEPKAFRQRRLCPQTGEWRWGLRDDNGVLQVRLLLFGTPLLRRYRNQAVFVVEGEKKALLLQEIGLLGVCGAGGAGMGWQEAYSQQLHQRHVVLVPDNDEPGRRLMDQAAGSLLRHDVRSLRIVQLPSLPVKGDVVDYAQQHGKEALRQALRQGQVWRSDAEVQHLLQQGIPVRPRDQAVATKEWWR